VAGTAPNDPIAIVRPGGGTTVQRPDVTTYTIPAGPLNPLVAVEELAGYLQRDLDRFSADMAVQGASGIVRGHCGWDIARTVETLTVDASGGASVNLPTLRLNDVTEVRVDGAVLDVADYGWSANGILVVTSAAGCWPRGLRRIAADVDHGYEPVPDEVRIVCCAIAARLYSNPENLLQRSTGNSSQMFRDLGFSELEARLIARYRLT
jgi:hypothetical protein